MDVRKNLLDLKYQKYLQFHIATVIIIFTYFIGDGIALLTKQIVTKSQVLYLLAISVLIISAALIILSNFNIKLNLITEEIKNL